MMELFVSIDPAFSNDSAGFCAGTFNRTLNGIKLIEVGEQRPPLTPDTIFALVETLTRRIEDKTKGYGYPARIVFDISSNFSLALELARRVPVERLALIKFHGADNHSPPSHANTPGPGWRQEHSRTCVGCLAQGIDFQFGNCISTRPRCIAA